MFIKNNILSKASGLLLTAAMAFTGTSCSDDDAPESSANKWDIAGNEVVSVKPERYKMLRNPLTGWVMYTGLGNGLKDTFWADYDRMQSSAGIINVSDYSNVLFIRAAWTYFNPEEGKYAWDDDCNTVEAQRFKMLVKGAKERNMMLAFSFICDSQDKHVNFTPEYVRQAGAQGYVTTTGSVQVWSPYPDDPVFQEKFAKFIHDFAAKYDDPDVTMFMSGTGLGKWGESHTVIYSTGNNDPRESVANWITDLYMNEFKRVPCFINYHRALLATASYTNNVSALTEQLIEMAVDKGFSLRNDAFGMKSYYSDWERNFAAAHRYKRPIIMEGGWVKTSHGGSIKGDGYADYADVRKGEYYEGKGANVNMMDFRYGSSLTEGETWSWFNEAYDLVTEFIAEGGYRLYPDKVSVPVSVSSSGNVIITHRWCNLGWGYCPTNIPQWNQKYKVAFALLDKATLRPVKVYVDEGPCLNDWIKGKPSTYESRFSLGGVAKGEYEWAVGLVDTTKDNEIGLHISAKEGITPEGWLQLTTVNVN